MSLLSRILVATDFSNAGRGVIARAGQLASRHGARLHVVHAMPDWALFSRWTVASREHYEAVTARAHRAMAAELAWVSQQFELQATHQVVGGRASRVILEAALDYRPQLLVVGARGEHQPRISPESLGGTTLKLLLHSDSPLLLVRGWDMKPYGTSLAAIHDRCNVSRRVVHWASALVGDGQCHLMHAYEAPYFERTRLCVDESVASECEEATEKVAVGILQGMAGAAAEAAQVHTHAVKGRPLPALVTEIARYQPTLVVLGRQEFGSTESRDPFGTDGFRMAYHCPVDTLVVP